VVLREKKRTRRCGRIYRVFVVVHEGRRIGREREEFADLLFRSETYLSWSPGRRLMIN
jgi:hypothetical protein